MELSKAKHRVEELDLIIQRIYEDNATGRLTNERFDKLYAGYEKEQSELKATVSRLTALLNTECENKKNVDLFLQLVKKYTDTSELTADIVRLFIEKVVFHSANGRWGKNRQQQIDPYWNFIGFLEEE